MRTNAYVDGRSPAEAMVGEPRATFDVDIAVAMDGRRAVPGLAAPDWGYSGGMPKVSVYLPDDLYDRARRGGLSLSEVTQRAVEAALREQSVARWVQDVRARRPRARGDSVDTASLMEAVRDEFGA